MFSMQDKLFCEYIKYILLKKSISEIVKLNFCHLKDIKKYMYSIQVS